MSGLLLCEAVPEIVDITSAEEEYDRRVWMRAVVVGDELAGSVEPVSVNRTGIALAQRRDESLRRHVSYILRAIPRKVNIRYDDMVSIVECGREIPQKLPCARVLVWLENDIECVSRVSLA